MQFDTSRSSRLYILYVVALIIAFSGCKEKNKPAVLTIFAASSLTVAVSEIVAAYEQNENVQVRLSFGASGTLTRQIAMGAEADIFISANTEWIDYLQEKQLIESWEDIAWNRLVLITYRGSRFDGRDTLILNSDTFYDVDKLAIGAPETVPAGMYARQALNHYGVFESLKPYYLMAKDVNTALRYVELKEASLGIVYHTDALRSQFVVPIFTFPENSHDPVVYRMAVMNRQIRVKTFLSYIRSRDALDIWRRYGFVVQRRPGQEN